MNVQFDGGRTYTEPSCIMTGNPEGLENVRLLTHAFSYDMSCMSPIAFYLTVGHRLFLCAISAVSRHPEMGTFDRLTMASCCRYQCECMTPASHQVCAHTPAHWNSILLSANSHADIAAPLSGNLVRPLT